MSLGQRIKERRQALGMTQRELANATQSTLQHISSIEQDKRLPSLSLMIILAERLDASLDYLILGIDGNLDVIDSIKRDKSLETEAKKSLIKLIMVMRNNTAK